MTWRGAFSGALALIALEAVVRTNTSASRVGQLLEDVAGLVARVLDPTVPAIPDLRDSEWRKPDWTKDLGKTQQSTTSTNRGSKPKKKTTEEKGTWT